MKPCDHVRMEPLWSTNLRRVWIAVSQTMLSGLVAGRHSLKWTAHHWRSTVCGTRCHLDLRRPLLGNVVLRKAHMNSVSRWTTAPSSRKKQKPVFARAPTFGDKLAIIDGSGTHSYNQLYGNSLGLAGRISTALNSDFGRLEGKRISFLCANDASYTVAQWAAWMSGGTAVPLYRKHPPSELEYIISDSQSSLLVAGHPYAETLEPLAQKLGLPCLNLPPTSSLDTLKGTDTQEKEAITDWAEQPAMIIYTSGTTGRPKGVLHTHSSIQAMVSVSLLATQHRRRDKANYIPCYLTIDWHESHLKVVNTILPTGWHQSGP